MVVFTFELTTRPRPRRDDDDNDEDDDEDARHAGTYRIIVAAMDVSRARRRRMTHARITVSENTNRPVSSVFS